MMKKLNETLKQMLDALAYAHAGDYLTLQEKTQILSQQAGTIATIEEPPKPAKADAGNHARQVALYLGSELSPEVMNYVIQTCARLQHKLTVLTFESERTGRALLQPYQEALDTAGVDMDLVTLKGEPSPGLARYLRSHPEVAFMACKDSGYLGRSYLSGSQHNNALPVPVVVVATQSEGAVKQLQPASDQNTVKTILA
jgi:hypothetical protein